MKIVKIIILTLCLFLIEKSFGQNVIYHKLPKTPKRVDKEKWVYTDTLSFKMPKNSKVLVYYHNEHLSGDSIEKKLTPVLKRAVKFPENTTKIYRFNRSFHNAGITGAINDINKLYTRKGFSVLMGIPLGLDVTGGDLAPLVGFRWAFELGKGFSYGLSFENQTFFEKSEGVLKSVDNNQFLNFELGFNPLGGMHASNNHVIQFGYLLNSQSIFYSGDTYKLAYRYTVKKWGNLQLIGGFMATDSFDKTFPFVGVRFF
jgi:hypothetical protein